jgi:quercetin dioxygenase-like cupin family protein
VFAKSTNRKSRTFKAVDFFVGAIGERMMVTLMTFRKGQEVGTHSHPHEQAGYCIGGRFTLTIGDESSVIEQNDSYVIPSGVNHNYRILEDSVAVEVFSPPREDYR